MFASGSSHASSYSNNSWICVSQREKEERKATNKECTTRWRALLDDMHWDLMMPPLEKKKWNEKYVLQINEIHIDHMALIVLCCCFGSLLECRHTSREKKMDRLLTTARNWSSKGWQLKSWLLSACQSVLGHDLEPQWGGQQPPSGVPMGEWEANVKVLGRAPEVHCIHQSPQQSRDELSSNWVSCLEPFTPTSVLDCSETAPSDLVHSVVLVWV